MTNFNSHLCKMRLKLVLKITQTILMGKMMKVVERVFKDTLLNLQEFNSEVNSQDNLLEL